MSFPDKVVSEAWIRADGKCECERESHGHRTPCGKSLFWKSRGREEGKGAWEAHHKESGGPDTLSNCEIICWDCHKETL